MMGVTPQIMSRAVLDPMVTYLEREVRLPDRPTQQCLAANALGCIQCGALACNDCIMR